MRSTPCHSFRPACSTQATFPLATVPSAFSSSLSSSRSPQPLLSVDAMWGGRDNGGEDAVCPTAPLAQGQHLEPQRGDPSHCALLRHSAWSQRRGRRARVAKHPVWPSTPCGLAQHAPLQVLSHDPGLVSEVPLCGQTRTLRYLLRVPRCCRQALELLHSYQGSQP